MSKGTLQIQMDFAKAKKQADELDEIAQQLRTLANTNLGDCMTEIGSNWTGENSQKYLTKCGTLKEKILKTAEQVGKTASTIRTIAETTYQAEMAAAIIAKTGY